MPRRRSACTSAAGSFDEAWRWRYALRFIVGAGLALILYCVVRGGLLSVAAGPQQLSPYGIAAFAGVTGMFSRQAVDKLGEVFDTFFQSDSASAAGAPKVLDVQPSELAAGADETVLQVLGSGFVAGSTVAKVGGAERPTTVVSPTVMQVRLTSADCAAAGTVGLDVVTPGQPPASVSLQVVEAGDPGQASAG